MTLEDEFVDIIKKARTGLSLPAEQVAKAAGLEASTLRLLEAGTRPPSRQEVRAIADALRLDGDKLTAVACDGWQPAPEHPRLQRSVLTIHGDIGGYAVKGYLFHDPVTREAVMIDTGCNPDDMLRAIEEHRLRLTAICLTHGHSDHADGIETILRHYPVPVYIGKEDWGLLGWKPPDNLRKFVVDGDGVTVGGKDLLFVTTPGHTAGGVCYRTAECEFVGDTLFAGSIGRANPSSLYATHLESVRKRLLTLPENLALFPGHGPSTTVREEKDHNPFG